MSNTRKYNYILGPIGTDSVSFSKPDGSPFTEEEQHSLLNEINDLMPKKIRYSHDGYFKTVVVLKAKNYILEDQNGKLKLKGSSLKDQKKEPALVEMSNEVIQCLISDNPKSIVDVYEKYVVESQNIKDITRWCTKKTISRKVLDCATNSDIRANEMSIYNAVKDIPGIQEGDKVYLYSVLLGYKSVPMGVSEKTGKPRKDKTVEVMGYKLAKDWTQDEYKDKLLDRVFTSISIFDNVLHDVELIDYSLKRNKTLLEELIRRKLGSI